MNTRSWSGVFVRRTQEDTNTDTMCWERRGYDGNCSTAKHFSSDLRGRMFLPLLVFCVIRFFFFFLKNMMCSYPTCVVHVINDFKYEKSVVPRPLTSLLVRVLTCSSWVSKQPGAALLWNTCSVSHTWLQLVVNINIIVLGNIKSHSSFCSRWKVLKKQQWPKNPPNTRRGLGLTLPSAFVRFQLRRGRQSRRPTWTAWDTGWRARRWSPSLAGGPRGTPPGS